MTIRQCGTLGLLLCSSLLATTTRDARAAELRLSRAEYADRVHAVWAGQMIGMLLAYPFEHRVGSVAWVDDFREPATWAPLAMDCARVDDDWYYEIVALRALERYGMDLTVEELGRQWIADSAGSWGSSAETRRLLLAGVKPPDTGHPRFNSLWYTIGPQFSADIYGAIAPGMPNAAGRFARNLGHINGYAEGADGAVFVAGMVSIAFTESDCRRVVRQASALIHPSSPYRQCLDAIIALGEAGASFEEVARAVAERWQIEYPATNNAVANGGRTWRLTVWVNNQQVDDRLIEASGGGRKWQQIEVDLAPFAGREVQIRVYQLFLTGPTRSPGSAYWRNLELK